jgi:hypothetical protein
MFYLPEICIQYKKKCDWNIFQAVKRGNFFIIPNFFQLRVKIVNKIIFLQTLVENVDKDQQEKFLIN